MKIHYSTRVVSMIFALLFVSMSTAQKQENLWSFSSLDKVKKENIIFYKSTPKNSVLVSLDIESLKLRLLSAPERGLSSDSEGVRINFPNQKGEFESYLVKEASVMTPELQSQFPDIRAYVGKGIDNPASIIRFSVSPEKGLSSMVLSDKKTVFIEPYSADLRNYIVFITSDEDGPRASFECETEYVRSEFDISNEEYAALRNANDQTLRTYRLALACTVEYSQFHGGTLGQVTAAMNTTMARVNGVFERDLGLTMVMVANASIIFLGPDVNSDPYTNNSGSTMLGQNQTTCNNNIGSLNYDIGHVFSTGGGGIASLNSPCNNGSKARGVTGSFSPIGDAFDIDYVAHEMGHQFGGNHTQNNNCQRSNVAVEPGSASTIMGYAGICSPNVQNNSDDYFHGENIKEMWLNISAGTSSTCFTGSGTSNVAPQVNAGANFSIPKSTAFVLRGSATDADTAVGLTYCWEQTDTTPAIMPPQSTNTGGPAFRSLDPKTSPDRYMPPLNTVMSGSLATTWEVIPSVARDMNFSLTVRDNELNGGATGSSEMMISVEDVTPFSVNTPATWGPNSSQQVFWVLGQTSGSIINCQSVNILFTINNGATFTTLASGVPNTGSATIIVPNISNTTNAKILVEAADNIFYAVSDVFSINNAADFSLNSTTGDLEICDEDSVTFDFEYNTTNGFSETTVFSASGVPVGANSTISPLSLSSSGTVSLTITGLSGIVNNDYTITLTGLAPSITKSASAVLSITDSACPVGCITYASATNLGLSIPDGVGSNTPGVALTDIINIPAGENIILSNVLVNVDISHSYIQDLVIELDHPSSTPTNRIFTTLWNRECGGQNNLNVTFEDGASVIECAQPTVGTYAPAGDLTVFNGLDSAGDWTLTIRDFFNADVGSLNNWSLELCSISLSVQENELENLTIYPNPNNGEFNIGFNPMSGEDIKVEIYDIRGRAIYSNSYSSVSRFEEVIRLNNAQSGVYLLIISDGPQKVIKKIIVD